MPNSQRDPTAALVIIGNEILSGKFEDTNSPFLLKELYKLGVSVKHVATVPDDIDVVAKTVRTASDAWDFVLTSGGVGPTHDDVTYPSIAKAFDLELVEEPKLMEMLRAHLGENINAAAKRMAMVPEGSRLLWKPTLRFPLLVCRNVYIFPGVPQFLRHKFHAIREEFLGRPYHLLEISTKESEDSIAARLEDTVSKFPLVEIGSYPKFESTGFWVLLTLQSKEEAQLLKARTYLCSLLDQKKLIRGA